MSLYMCRFCGESLPKEMLDRHYELKHAEEIAVEKKDRAELIRAIEEKESMIKHKAKMYDNLIVKALMCCGIVDDGEETRYVIDPQSFTDIVLKEILSDIKIDRDKFIFYKQMMIKDVGGIDG